MPYKRGKYEGQESDSRLIAPASSQYRRDPGLQNNFFYNVNNNFGGVGGQQQNSESRGHHPQNS